MVCKNLIRNNSGVSITEFMIVIAFIAILSAIAVPNFIGWMPKYRLSSGARDVLSVIKLTRLTAVRQYDNAVIQFNMGNSSYNASVGGQTFKSGNMPAGVTISAVTFGGSSLTFDRQGTPSEGGNVTLSSSAGNRTINVNMAGNVRIP